MPLDMPELVLTDPPPEAPTPPPTPVSSPPDPPVPVLVTPDVSPHAANRPTKVTAQAPFRSLLVVASTAENRMPDPPGSDGKRSVYQLSRTIVGGV